MARKLTPELKASLSRLWYEYKELHCRQARGKLIDYYRYLIVKTRQRILPTVPVKIAAEDLDQEGYIALIRAVDHFDLRRKVKFESYAISTIRGAMLEYLRREDWIPRSVRTKQKLIGRAVEELVLQRGDRNVTDTDVAGHLDMPIDAFYQLYYEANVLQVVSLEDMAGDSEHDDSDHLVVLESVKSTAPDAYMQAVIDAQRDLLLQCVSWLPTPERRVVVLYYYQGKTLKEIAQELGRSESRAHQLHARAIQRLQGFITRQKGLFFPERLPVPLIPEETSPRLALC